MQYGQQRQRVVPNQPHGRRTRAKPAYKANSDDLASAHRSAARLAAEAAFAEPQILKPLLYQTQVIVRRSRSVSLGIKAVPDHAVATRNEPAVKCARVFRVEGSPPAPIADPVRADAASMPIEDVPVQESGSPRSRRRANDQKPGPVLHVLHPLPKRPATELAETRLDHLIAELAGVGPILESIERAQALEVRDHGSAAAWEQVSKTAECIRAEVLVLLNASAIPRLIRST